MPRIALTPHADQIAVVALTFLLATLPGRAHAEDTGSSRVVGSGVAKTESRNVSDFHAIALGIDARLELRQGDSEGMSITGDDNIVPLVEAIVEKGILKIRWLGNRNYSPRYKALDIVVNAKNVDAFGIGGSGRIHADRLKTGKLRVGIGGSGGIAIDALDADSAHASIDGSGYFKAGGRVDALDVSLAGSGDVSAAKLESRQARITVAGSGNATIWVKETLSTTIAGSGDVRYYGKPKVSQSIAGSGRVRDLGAAP